MLLCHQNEWVYTGILYAGQPAKNCLLTPFALSAGKAMSVIYILYL